MRITDEGYNGFETTFEHYGEGWMSGCERLQKALCECHKRVGSSSRTRESACRHLNRALAQCLVAEVCPEESEAVQSLCASGGTALKRSQCQQAQLSLSFCLSSHTSPNAERLSATQCTKLREKRKGMPKHYL
ncbi:uncharacterized protein LOC123226882 isoform X2 [Mangifera indica]|uniref:uncharacterized protein LOC123226882 isoform X2 n=1 Tax=Mangifera indica TaxID=29780 RepID=UPI001CFB44E7|nr:uncharacterized protein LOC123226882 isoform X2 [Mangifera indica]